MKAIILAAGMGTRLGKYTQGLPKGMLAFMGKTLIERQVEVLRSENITDITIIRGYMPHKINIHGMHYLENPDFSTTNMVTTLMAAREQLLNATEDVLVCYSDIIYERRLIETIKRSNAQVSVLADDNYLEYWQARLDDWQNDIESLQYDDKNNIFEIGTPRCPLEHAKSRYVGMIKFTPQALKELVHAFDQNKKQYWDSDAPWRKSKSFRKAYMTCMLQELVDRGVEVKAVRVSHGWMEFDTVEDYEKALTWVKNGILKRFIAL